MVKIRYSPDNLYRKYGIKHFISRYKIPLEMGPDKTGKELTIDIKEGDITPHAETWVKTEYGRIPIFQDLGDSEYREENGNNVKINFDLFNAIGHMLSGHFENFSSEEKRTISSLPVVDIYEKILFDDIARMSSLEGKEIKSLPIWPEGKSFAVCLSHDVDEVRKTYQYFTRTFIYSTRGQFLRAGKQMCSFFCDKVSNYNPYWTFDDIMRIEKRLGVRSSFYFLQESGKVEPFKPATWKLAKKYRFCDPDVSRVMKRLIDGGWEVGLHGSYYSYLSEDKLRREKNDLESAIGQEICGIRQHYLSLNIPDTWDYHQKIGLQYDTSLGYNRKIGFRWGTCFPFYPMNPSTGDAHPLLQIPLMIMDTPLHQGKGDVSKKILKMLSVIEQQNGLMTLLFHHDAFNERECHGWPDKYEKIVDYCKRNNAWIATSKEINDWWRKRECK
jgi:peptidoglycan/xylan/chitin deacetylase (PgdA/CDA1 family)